MAAQIEAGGWKGEKRDQMAAVCTAWAQGKEVVAVSDGAYRRGMGADAARGGGGAESVLACGWVLCAAEDGAEGRLSGAEVQTAPPVCGQGGFRIASHGSVESTYLAELAGALDVLRSLMECVGGGGGRTRSGDALVRQSERGRTHPGCGGHAAPVLEGTPVP